jgi:hypothetical protein
MAHCAVSWRIPGKRWLVNGERVGSKASVTSNVAAIADPDPPVSAETVSLLEQLLEEARAGSGYL